MAMSFKIRRKTELGLGLDISDRIRLVKVQKKSGWQIEDFVSMELPGFAMETGALNNPETLGNYMIPLVNSLKGKALEAAANIPASSVFFRTLILPRLPPKELHQAAVFAAGSFLPIPIEEAVISTCPVNDYIDASGVKTQVFLVAARRQHVAALQTICRISGIKLAAIEIEPLSIQRFLQLDNKLSIDAYLYLNSGYSAFCVFKDQVLLYQRALDLELIVENPAPVPENQLGKSRPQASLDITAGAFTAKVITEVRQAVELYRLHNHEYFPDSILLFGTLAGISDIDSILKETLGIKVIKPDLEPLISWPESRSIMADEFATAIGLAIREEI